MILKKSLLMLAANVLIAGPIQAGAADADKPVDESAQAMEANIVVTSIRDKGYPCRAIRNMERIERDNPDIRSAWQVRCDSGRSYRVVYLGDRGYEVQAAE